MCFVVGLYSFIMVYIGVYSFIMVYIVVEWFAMCCYNLLSDMLVSSVRLLNP